MKNSIVVLYSTVINEAEQNGQPKSVAARKSKYSRRHDKSVFSMSLSNDGIGISNNNNNARNLALRKSFIFHCPT